MSSPSLVDQLSEALRQVLPSDASSDMQKNIRAAIQGALDRAGVVTREELEIQEAVLARTREKLEALEQRLLALEKNSPQNS
jgi:BMFP domain-containing protein YqiC